MSTTGFAPLRGLYFHSFPSLGEGGYDYKRSPWIRGMLSHMCSIGQGADHVGGGSFSMGVENGFWRKAGRSSFVSLVDHFWPHSWSRRNWVKRYIYIYLEILGSVLEISEEVFGSTGTSSINTARALPPPTLRQANKSLCLLAMFIKRCRVSCGSSCKVQFSGELWDGQLSHRIIMKGFPA